MFPFNSFPSVFCTIVFFYGKYDDDIELKERIKKRGYMA